MLKEQKQLNEVRVSVNVDRETHQLFKAYCAMQGKTIKEVIVKYIKSVIR